MNDKRIAIIPARGGSKRIFKKNIKNFLGKPIIAYSIDAALKSEFFEEIIVSTDDLEIAEIAVKYGAKVPFIRSSKTSDDHATTMDVIHEVLNSYSNNLGKRFKYACCIYATSPLIQINSLSNGFYNLTENNFTCVFPSVAFSSPVWRGITIEENGKCKMLWPEHENSRTQDLPKVYHDAGQWYWFNTEKLDNWSWPENTGSIVLSEEYVQDIDTMNDWRLAEMKYKLMKDG